MKRLKLAILLVFLLAAFTSGHVADPIKPVPQELFKPITVNPNPTSIIDSVRKPEITKPPIKNPEPKPNIIIKATPKPIKPPTKAVQKFISTSHSVTGYASWYCKAGVSVCHHSYPAGSMVAAACGKLRAAMGSNWRGKIVTVRHDARIVQVKLVDWCGSKDKLIDLYWEPMRRLGGTGVLHVRVSW